MSLVGRLGVSSRVPLVSVGFGGAIAYQRGCSLSSLGRSDRQNSFIYAADGSRLGSIPSERNRQPVKWSRISPWLPKATVAVEDKRFWEHGGIDPMGITRALWEDLRAGKVVQGGSTITQQLVRNLYISRERTLDAEAARGVPRGEALAQVVEAQDPHAVPEPRVLRQPGVRGRGGVADVLLEAREEPDAVAGRAARRPAASPVAYDPVADPHAARVRRNEVLRAMYTTGVITRHQYRVAVRIATST